MYENVTPPPYENVELPRETSFSTASATTESSSANADSVSTAGDSVNLSSESAMAAAPYSMIADVTITVADYEQPDPVATRPVDYDNVVAGFYNDATSAPPNRGAARCSEYEDVEGVARPAIGEYAGLQRETINVEYEAPYTVLSETRDAGH